MGVIITTKQANDHLRLDMEGEDESPQYGSDERLSTLLVHIAAAEGVIVNYLKLDPAGLAVAMNGDADTSPETPATWSTYDAANVRAAVLLALSAMHDDSPERTLGDYMRLNTGVIPLLLMRLRDPALA